MTALKWAQNNGKHDVTRLLEVPIRLFHINIYVRDMKCNMFTSAAMQIYVSSIFHLLKGKRNDWIHVNQFIAIRLAASPSLILVFFLILI
jgi:hypothetical protein